MINQSKLEYIITQIQSKKVLVVGDIMLDKYVFGHVDRISPEAPIPIISVKNTRLLEGGAGNVIKNLNSLNIKTAFISLIGNDASGKTLKARLKKLKNIEYALLQDNNRKTTLKTRYIANGQQLFRTDEETISSLNSINTFSTIFITFASVTRNPLINFDTIFDLSSSLFILGPPP